MGVPGDPTGDSSDSDSMGGKQSVAAHARANGGIVHGSSTFEGGFGGGVRTFLIFDI